MRTTYRYTGRTARAAYDHITINSYDVNELARRFSMPPVLVEKIIKQEGPSRSAVETYLARMKRNAKR